jgi:enterochelin esterase family protein
MSASDATPRISSDVLTFRVADRDRRYVAVRLSSDLPLDGTFTRDGDDWVLTVDPPDLARLEYRLELEHTDGTTETVCDPDNPERTPGVFGEKSVMLTPGYEPPAWLHADAVEGRVHEFAVRARGLGTDMQVQIWDGGGAPLLVAHDGPEYDQLASLTRYSGAMIASGALPPHRVALLAPVDRDEWYSASRRYAQALTRDVMRALDAVDPVGMGASLGALAMLHAHVRRPFAGLFLQSGSFFELRHDAHEHRHPRFSRIIRAVRELKRDAGVPERVTMTCGALEENLANNREMARALAAQEFDVELQVVPDMHNYIGWRDALHPYLTHLLLRVWG